MNYIGSKRTLLPRIEQIVTTLQGTGSAIDLFAGTGAVSALLTAHADALLAIDRQYYATVQVQARCSPPPPPARLYVEQLLVEAPPKFGIFVDEYGEGGVANRLYFSTSNAAYIEGCRSLLEEARREHKLDKCSYYWGLAVLLEAADQVANCAAVYAAYLKKLKKTALLPLDIPRAASKMASLASSTNVPVTTIADDTHAALQKNSMRFWFAYLDPPYNHRAYNSNYHLLETIARWDLDRFAPRGVAGLRPIEAQSGWNSRRHAANTLRYTLQHLDAEYLLFSYNDEGILTREQLQTALSEWGEIKDWQKIEYRRYRADNGRTYSRDGVTEWLILVKGR